MKKGSRYAFEFVNEGRIGSEDARLWFRVSDIMSYSTMNSCPRYVGLDI